MAGGSGGGPLAEAPLVIPLGRGCAGLDMYVSLMSKGENFCNSEIRPFAEAPLVIPPGRTCGSKREEKFLNSCALVTKISN